VNTENKPHKNIINFVSFGRVETSSTLRDAEYLSSERNNIIIPRPSFKRKLTIALLVIGSYTRHIDSNQVGEEICNT